MFSHNEDSHSTPGVGRERAGIAVLALPATSLSSALSPSGKLLAFLVLCVALLGGCSDYIPAEKEVTWSPREFKVAYPDHCPDWRHSPIINYDNSAMSNHGCATAVNFGKMVANPHDMYRGRGMDGAQTESSVDAVKRLYRGEFLQKTADYQKVTAQ